MSQSSLNPVDATVALLLLVVSPEAARVVGPYAVIILAAVTGAAWSLGRREPTPGTSDHGSRGNALVFLMKIILTAVLITVGLASAAKEAFSLSTDVNWLLAPIGMLVGGVGHDWPNVGKWIINRLGRLIDRRIETPNPRGDNDANG